MSESSRWSQSDRGIGSRIRQALVLSFCFALTAATGARASAFLAGYVQDSAGIGIGGATVVLDYAGTKLEELRTAPDGWFESGNLEHDSKPASVHMAVLKEGFGFHRSMVKLESERTFVRLTLKILEGAVFFEEEQKGGDSLLVHGYVDNEVDQTPIVAASVAIRVGARQVGFAYSSEDGYFSIPVDWEYRDSPAEIKVDHPLHDSRTVSLEKLAPNLPPKPLPLAPSSGLRLFVSYTEVFKNSYNEFHLPNVVFGRNPGFTNVSARIGEKTVPAILEANSWQIEISGMKTEQAHDLMFQFQLAMRNLPKSDRNRLLSRMATLRASGTGGTEAGELRRLLDATLRKELDGFLGVLDAGLRKTLNKRRVTPPLAAALHEMGAEIPPKSLIEAGERDRAWHLLGGEKNNLFIVDQEGELAVFQGNGGSELHFSSVCESPANEQILVGLLQDSALEEDPESALLDLEIVQRVVRRPPAADRQRFGLGFRYGMFFPARDNPQIASYGLGYEAVLSTFPLLRWRSSLEKYSTRDLRSNFSIDLGAGFGHIQRSVPAGGTVTEKGAVLSLGLGYYLSDNMFISLGAYRQENPSLMGAYLALGLGFFKF